MPRTALPSGRKFLLLLLTLATVVIGGAWWSQRPPPEPVYHGQRLSEWLKGVSQEEANREREIEEVHAFGPAAVTWLIYTLEHGQHPFKRHGSLPFDNAPVWLLQWLPERWGGLLAPRSDERTAAAFGLYRLGAEAEPAIPALVKCLDCEYPELVTHAAYALHAIGSVSQPAIEDALAHASKQARIELLDTMWHRFEDPDEPEAEFAWVVDTLVKASHDPDAEVRQLAVQDVEKCSDLRPDAPVFNFVLPGLIRALSDSNPEVRRDAVHVLVVFGANAAPALTRVIELLDDPSAEVRSRAARFVTSYDTTEKHSAARLRAMLNDSDASCREAAADALRGLDLTPEAETGGREPGAGQ